MTQQYDAKIIFHMFGKPDDLQDLVGKNLQGWVFEDTKQDGNHPFEDGKFVAITKIQEVFTDANGIVYVKTLNTTYQVIAAAKDKSGAFKYMEILAQERGSISLSGDPISN